MLQYRWDDDMNEDCLNTHKIIQLITIKYSSSQMEIGW